MTKSEIDRLHDRAWLTTTFTLWKFWWVLFAPYLAKILKKWNLEASIPLWHTTLHLRIGEEIVIEVFSKNDPNHEHSFKLKIWRTRFFTRCAPVFD